ncbi:glycosyltransferase family 2 protein [Vibrio superstes]|uniref:Glycosyltransferase 2-like domain-containing protein n=1 Tax=Vibrio superstes NBRC 103154 TaxID=1219062 RepID=A0A511QVD3_9VIBR|nr:glycosyltransferase family 2 protein [Vibrio superstes]GEM81328.1 hypothetical protein VSU01S_35730 [Vibrio superstes NBRC 103154]
MKNIDVVMATYNGEAYLAEQLQSIIDCKGFDEHINRIIISDDGSDDRTLEIARQFNCDRIEIHINQGTKGVIGNFNNAVAHSTADYVIFSDQDDVWCGNKIHVLYEGITHLEKSKHNTCLFFTDLELVNYNLESINHSFWDAQNLDPRLVESFSSISMQNVTPGCALVVNRSLLKITYPCPSDVVMHDWWLLLNARLFGHIGYSREVTMKYRQHATNTIGTTKPLSYLHMKRVLSRNSCTFTKILNQLSYLAERLPKDHPDAPLLNVLSKIKTLSISKRLKLLHAIRSPYLSFERSSALFFRIMLLK